MRTITRIIVHCTGAEYLDTAQKIKTLHVHQNGWDDIGYHWVIDPYGLLQEGRSEGRIGAHCRGYNHDSIGVCLCGDRHFGSVQVEQFWDLCHDLFVRYNLSYNNVYCHYQFNPHKTCPNVPVEFIRAYLKGKRHGFDSLVN